MPVNQVQNFYKDTVKTAWGAGTGNFYVSGAAPTISAGIIVVSPGDASKREIIRYTATGSDGGGAFVTVSNLSDRGLGGTVAQTHAIGEKVRMNLTAQHWQEVVDELLTKYGPGVTVPTPTLPGDAVNKAYADTLAIAGAADAGTATKGVSKLTAAPLKSLGTATITIASPAVVTLTAHGLIAGDTIQFTTTGSLPTGLAASTTYFVIATGLTANTFQLALTSGGAAINTTGSQSGIHTLFRTTPFAVGDQDARMLTTDQKAAAAGTSGTPSAANPFVTAIDESRNYGSIAYAATATGNDTYVVTLSPAPTSLVNGMIIRVKFDVANTGAATLNANGFGALSIVTGVSTALSTGNIVAEMIGVLVYNSTGTVWQLLNPQTPDNVYATVAVTTSTSTNGITDDAATTTITTFKTGRLLLTFNGEMFSGSDSQNYSFIPQVKVGSAYYGGGRLDYQSGDDARVFPGSFSVITDSLAAGVYTIRGAINFAKGFSTTFVQISGNIQAITL